MFWVALELSIPKIAFNIILSLTVKKLDAFKFDVVAESDNTARVGQHNNTNSATERIDNAGSAVGMHNRKK